MVDTPPSLLDSTTMEPQTQTQTQTRTINYRDSLPGAPKPMYARESFDESIFREYTDDAIMNATPSKQPASKMRPSPPALPQKSSLRSSRVLDALPLKMDAAADESTLAQTSAPHEVYLSSEEDASSSADDFSDYDFDSSSEQDPADTTTASRKKSYEDIAKMVAVVFSGKPTIVQITTVKRSDSPNTPASRSSTPNFSHRQSNVSSVYHPPRTTSLALEGLTLHTNKSQPAFLGVDPYADTTPEEAEAGRTPTNSKNAASMFKKTLGLVKKRSRPLLMTNMANSSLSQLDRVASPSIRDSTCEAPESPITPLSPESRTSSTPVTYQEIMKNAKRNASISGAPQSPNVSSPVSSIQPEKRNRILSGLSMSRRRSIKAG